MAKPFLVTEHRARKYRCPRTGRIIVAPLPAEVTAASFGAGSIRRGSL